VDGFTDLEPLVGEIVALRTFRIDDSGLLLALYSDTAWYDGTNRAVCAPPTGSHPRGPHPVPDPECECGFYAYGSREAAARNRHLRYVQAVVSFWGSVVAGTIGVRAQYARIDALWISPRAPAWLRTRVAQRYPSARMYTEVDAMLAEHPLSALPCFGAPARPLTPPRLRNVAAGTGAAALLALGLLPFATLQASALLWFAWITATAVVATATGWLLLGTRGAGHLAAAFVLAGVLAWLLAPTLGLSGWLLRVPVLRGLLVATVGCLATLRPHHFPVVRTARVRAFAGVRT
jgi:hypothetical protein